MSTESGETGESLTAEEKQNYLNEGNLVPVKSGDELTANGLDTWADSPPKYQNFDFESYVHFDIQEWSSKLQKYKREFVRQADRIRRLRPEVEQLRKQMGSEAESFDGLDEQIEDTAAEFKSLMEEIDTASAEHETVNKEITTLKQHREHTKQDLAKVTKAILACNLQTGYLQEEYEGSKAQHSQAMGEKTRLSLERAWFMNERIILEETTRNEADDAARLRESVEKLRHCMQRTWKETKEYDTLGHLRATKQTPADNAWFDVRRRKFVRAGDSYVRADAVGGSSEMSSSEG